MSHLRDVEQHARSLTDIRQILNSMKSLAYMEMHKLDRIVEAQRAVTGQIEEAAADFLRFHPDSLPAAVPTLTVRVAFGTERGFCGNLNERLASRLTQDDDFATDDSAILIAVGRKLHSVLRNRLPETDRVRFLDGASVAEEATSVLHSIVGELDALQSRHVALTVSALYHGGEAEILSRELLPPFREELECAEDFMHPPLVNLRPAELLLDLGDQYLFSVLFEMQYDALRNENLHRVTHLSDAVRHLDDQMLALAHRANALRQEQITEEIEVILLSASSLADLKPVK